jgi:hypothetical protein
MDTGLMRYTVITITLLLAAAALAQQPQPQAVQARIEQQLGSLMVQNAALAAQVEGLQAQLKAAHEAAAKCAPPPPEQK